MILITSVQGPPVCKDHYLLVPWVVAIDRFIILCCTVWPILNFLPNHFPMYMQHTCYVHMYSKWLVHTYVVFQYPASSGVCMYICVTHPHVFLVSGQQTLAWYEQTVGAINARDCDGCNGLRWQAEKRVRLYNVPAHIHMYNTLVCAFIFYCVYVCIYSAYICIYIYIYVYKSQNLFVILV